MTLELRPGPITFGEAMLVQRIQQGNCDMDATLELLAGRLTGVDDPRAHLLSMPFLEIGPLVQTLAELFNAADPARRQFEGLLGDIDLGGTGT